MLLAALFGALYAAAAVFSRFLSILTVKLIAGAFMVLIAFGAVRYFFRIYLVFTASAASFAGVVLAAEFISGGDGRLSVPSYKVLFISFGICWAVFSFVFRQTIKHRVDGNISELEIEHNGRRIKVSALEDTGNTLRDPMTGRPVVICDRVTAASLLDAETAAVLTAASPGEEAELLARLAAAGNGTAFSLIPYGTVNGRGMFLAFRPDSIRKNGRSVEGLVAVSLGDIPKGNGYTVISGAA